MIARGMIYINDGSNDVADIIVGVEENMVLLVWVEDDEPRMWRKATRLFRQEQIFGADGESYVRKRDDQHS